MDDKCKCWVLGTLFVVSPIHIQAGSRALRLEGEGHGGMEAKEEGERSSASLSRVPPGAA